MSSVYIARVAMFSGLAKEECHGASGGLSSTLLTEEEFHVSSLAWRKQSKSGIAWVGIRRASVNSSRSWGKAGVRRNGQTVRREEGLFCI
jgi:hypothetical protein